MTDRWRDPERTREGVTMALYVSLSLLAVLVAVPADATTAAAEPAVVIVLTSLGLLLAHIVAFRISSRLVSGGLLGRESLELLGAQLVGGAIVTAVAAIPALVVGGADGIAAAELVLVGFIALVAYVAARSGPASRLRALAYVAGVVVVSLVVLGIESLAGH